MKADFYEVLGVAEDADFDAIRRAFKSAAKRSHPDRGGTADEFESLKLAYECLSDSVQREAYDRMRSSWESDADEADAKALVSFLSERHAKRRQRTRRAHAICYAVGRKPIPVLHADWTSLA
jgi:DnaJ-class molecular chaperone